MSRICARRLMSAVVCPCVLWLSVGSISGSAAGPRPSDRRMVCKVTGVAWNADNTPVSSAKIRLRNILTGIIDDTAIANSEGQFTFEDVAAAFYVVELVDDGGRVRALGQRFQIEAGETIATFVRLPASKPWFTGFFSNAALAAIAAASTAGVTAVGSNAPPASPQ